MANDVRGKVIVDFRCWRCTALIAEKAGPGTEAKCLRCGAKNRAPTAEQAEQILPESERSRPTRQDALAAEVPEPA